jgi:hypothetical protein
MAPILAAARIPEFLVGRELDNAIRRKLPFGTGAGAVRTNNWLAFFVQTRLRGKKLTYADVPLTSKEFRRLHQLPPGISASLKYVLYSPASVIDRMLWPAIEAAQILAKKYGISTYAARKL